jgi:ABC-type multidrug transport system ATPase subunit
LVRRDFIRFFIFLWLFLGPPLVAILDEPTTGVDPHARQQMQEIFLNAVKAKLTIILTSHSMDEW